ncbi:MAG: protein kinase [Chloroflexi bacterium]|nr:protein kinase [Chloroflexota bacterium]
MLIGHYHLGDKLGSGAMGDVYKATDTESGQIVAIKRLKAELVNRDPVMLERFVREGQALQQLDHPNIVKMLDAVTEGDNHYIVMEYVAGGDLISYLRAQQPLPIMPALHIAIQLADALTRSHYLDIIHRDIKPANILVTEDGVPKLTDFGIARFTAAETSPTETGMVIGTYAYLSPEACMGMPPDARTDIWAFGVVLYEMLTGRRPFVGSSPGTLVVEILKKPFPDPQELRPDISDDLTDLLYRMLEKNRDARIPSVRLVGAEIEAMLKGIDFSADRASPVTLVMESMFATPMAEQAQHNLPHQVTPFVGRTTELAELQRLIDKPDIRLITVHGPGGMGKSRLAVEVGRTQLQAFPDGVCFVELAPLANAANIPSAIAEAARYRFTGTDSSTEQIVTFLGNKKMLLILDNFEHVMAGRDLVMDILEAAPEVTFLVTSRERLNLRAETVFTLGGLDFPAWETPVGALKYSAVQLFMRSAQHARVDFELQQEDLDYLARICRLVQGTPLGLILAAGWVDTLPLDEIAAEIADSIDFLETELTDLPDRQRSIRAAFDYSWNLLSKDEREMFSRLSVFRGSFTHKAAKTVTGASLRHLTNLANKSLIGRNPESGRFEVHELLRQIAHEYLTDDAAAIYEAHATYYLTALTAKATDLKGRDQLGAMKAINSEFENVRAAWVWAVEHDQRVLLTDSLSMIALACQLNSRFDEAHDLLVRVMDRYAPHDQLLWYRALLEREMLYPLGRSFDDVEGAIHQSLTIAQDAGDRTVEALAWRAIGWVHLTRFEKEAIEAFQKSLALTEELADDYGRGEALHRLGFAHYYLRQTKEDLAIAEDFTQQAEAVRRANGDVKGLVATINNLAIFAHFRGDTTHLDYCKEAVRLARQVGDPGTLIFPLTNLAIYLIYTERDMAQRIGRELLDLAQQTNNPRDLNAAYGLQAAFAAIEGDYEEALRWTDKQLVSDSSDIQVIGTAAYMRVLYMFAIHGPEAAVTAMRETFGLIPIENTFSMAMALRALIPLITERGDYERATAVYALAQKAATQSWAMDELIPILRDTFDHLREELGEEAFEAAWERGQQMDIVEVFNSAVAIYVYPDES